MVDTKESLLATRRLYLLLTRGLCLHEPEETLRRALDGGVDLVQVREKPFGPGAPAWILAVQRICKRYEVPVVINDELSLLRSSGAFGLHLGQEDLDQAVNAGLEDRDFALGISTHSEQELARALRYRPDYIGIGPCFPTKTKGYAKGNEEPILRLLFEKSPVPAFAIGGITVDRMPKLLELGASRIAVSAAILGAEAPERAAAQLRAALDKTRPR